MQPNWSQTLINLTVRLNSGRNFTGFYNRNAAAQRNFVSSANTDNQESVNTDKLMLKPRVCHQRVDQPDNE